MATQLAFEEFRLVELQVPPSRPKSAEGFLVEFEFRRRMAQELGLFVERSRDFMPWIRTPKFVEEVVIEVMKTDKASELFQTMAIMSLNMGNLTLELWIVK